MLLMQPACGAQPDVPRTHSFISTSQRGPSNLHLASQAWDRAHMHACRAEKMVQGRVNHACVLQKLPSYFGKADRLVKGRAATQAPPGQSHRLFHGLHWQASGVSSAPSAGPVADPGAAAVTDGR